MVVLRHEDPIGDSYLDSRDELIEQMRSTGYRRALIILEGPGFGANAFQIHNHISYLATHLPRGIKLAAVLGVEEEIHEAKGFADVVAGNRGLDLKTFYDRERAVAWLGSGPGGIQDVSSSREAPDGPDEVDSRR